MSKKLPENPDLEQLRAQAKELLKAARSGDRATIVRFENYQLGGERGKLQLADAQLLLSREYEYSSWRELKRHVDHLSGERPTLLETAILQEGCPVAGIASGGRSHSCAATAEVESAQASL